MEKNFIEIFTDSLSVFKKSFLPSLGVLVVFLVLIFILSLGFVFMFGVETFYNLRNTSAIPGIGFLLSVFVFAILMLVIQSAMYGGMILVIRNNALVGKSFFQEAISEALRKLWKIILASFLMAIIFIVLYVLSIVLMMKVHIFIGVIFLGLSFLALCPPMFTAFYGIVCREGNFWDVFSDTISLGFSKWLKIIGFLILLIVGIVIISIIVGLFVGFLAGVMHSDTIAALFMGIFNLCIFFFSLCFCTVFYLDIAGIKPQKKVEMEEATDIHPAVEQRTEPTADENTEPPHTDSLN